MLLFVFFAHLLLVQLEAVNGIKVLFYSLPYESLLFNVTIGTPGQPIAVKINNGAYWESLAQTGPAIDFDNKTIGITGTDKFSIGDSTVDGKSFKVINEAEWQSRDNGQLGITRSTDGSFFLETILRDFDEQILVFSFDPTIDQSDSVFKETGILSFGDRQADRCANDWTLVPEVPPVGWQNEQWSVQVDEISFGAYTFDAPGQAFFFFDMKLLTLPTQIYAAVRSLLDEDSEGLVDCDTQLEIVFTVNGREIRVLPADYLDRSQQATTGRCYPWIDGTDDQLLTFPATVFNRLCLLFDYRLPGIGVATRLISAD